jgi:hypothetical protein
MRKLLPVLDVLALLVPIVVGLTGLYWAIFSTHRQSLGIILAVMTYYFWVLRGAVIMRRGL